MVVLSKAELKREKKRIYTDINAEVNPRMEEIKKVSPLYDFVKGSESRENALKRINIEQFAMDNGISPDNVPNVIQTNKIHKPVWENLYKLIKYDIAFTKYGIEDAKENIETYISSVAYHMYLFNTKEKYEMVEKILNLNLMSKMTSARVLSMTYYENNDMESEYTEKIAKLLFDELDIETTLSVLELDIEGRNDKKEKDMMEELNLEDAVELKKLIQQDEIFYVYRGFLVEQDEYVRLGKKEDGNSYYRWNAGKGISFSLNEDVAKYFCFWKMMIQEKVNPDNIPIPKKYEYTPPSLYTKEEFYEVKSEVLSQMIDKCGKKPIVAKFMVDPKTIRSHNVDKSENEVIVNPEDTQLVNYKILKPEEIVDGIIHNNRVHFSASDYTPFFERERMVSFMLNGMKNLYAKSEDVYDTVVETKKKLQQCAKKDDIQSANDALGKIQRTFAEFAVSPPQRIKQGKSLTREVIEWFSRKPEKILEETT